jgi:Cd2+/Zn2+-exporting ATPase
MTPAFFEEPVESSRTAHTHVWRVTGLDCPNCAREIESAIRGVNGVDGAELDFMGSTLRVLCRNQENCREVLSALAKDHGVEFHDLDQEPSPRFVGLMPREAVVMLVSGVIMGIAWISGTVWLNLVAMIIAGTSVAGKAISDIRRREISMNVLMGSAAIGAVIIKEWHEGAMVLFLYAVAKWLERLSSEKARSSIESLKLQLPAVAHVVRDGETKDLPLTALNVGDRFHVKPGEKIPADGVVESGRSGVDESMLTGEAEALLKEAGSLVYAGTWNQNGTLVVETTVPASESRFSRIMHSVEQAQSRKTQFQGVVEKFAAVYTPIVVLLALMLAILPPALGFGGFRDWLYTALVMLVIACPCALVIAAPVTLVAGLTAAARAGILVRGGDVLEAASKAKVLALDKTGTITRGRPQVMAVQPLAGSEPEILALAAALESASEHPLAAAFHQVVRERGIQVPVVQEFLVSRGRGIEGWIDRKRYRFGQAAWAREIISNHSGSPLPTVGECLTEAVLTDDQRVLGVVSFGDCLRPEASRLSHQVRELGIERVVLLSGDRQTTVEEFGRAIHVDEASGGLLPEEKANRIEALERAYGPVVMVGDGVNDTPALVTAQVGIAMGHRGSDAVLETSGAVLLHDNLLHVLAFLAIAQRSHRLIRQNIILAVGLKLAVFLAALGGYAALWLAVLADTGATVLVVINGLRALRPVGAAKEEPDGCSGHSHE